MLAHSTLAGAVFPATRALAWNVRVGLGTDVAGGSHPGLLPQCVNAATMSRVLDDGVNAQRPADARGVSGSRIDIVAAFHLATKGGVDILDIPCGLLQPGRAFDAIIVDLGRPGSSLRVWHDLDDEARIFEKIVRLATPEEISSVWVAGRRVSD